MTDDATLSDFTTATDEETGDESPDSNDVAGMPPVDSNPDSESKIGARDVGFSTYASGEYSCWNCKRTTDRVWRDDGELVCPDCKEW
ncbi:DUF7573 domain-containing protein [Natrinema halophilum]|uniref:DUF7573 domain-containing protein n=1 Tax=Natrinema halophilum TaxID=1699371 RepID=A0A7D5H857_9EURY|nr:hypothetical protein [Natrinema halophilum]QLG49535.1 hypothetical protein HYG82_12010 [Natrinema halophilum]